MIQNLATQKMIQALKEQIMKEQFDEKYPVGNGHYIQFQGMAEPSVAFAKYGATWQIDTDYTGRVLVGSGTGFPLIGEGLTGGEATHTLTVAEMPEHTHNYYPFSSDETVGYDFQEEVGAWTYVDNHASKPGTPWTRYGGYSTAGVMTESGGGSPHSNMQPYKVVSVWKRTA